jgi:hypothetical protein
MATPAVGKNSPVGGDGERFRELTPQGHGAEAFVQ